MATAIHLTTIHLILQGEGVKATGEWFGFYAARQVRAPTEKDAAAKALAAFKVDWEGPSRHLGELTRCQVVTAWRTASASRRKVPNEGHTFYNDDAEAQKEALRLEASAVSAPPRTIHLLLDELA